MLPPDHHDYLDPDQARKAGATSFELYVIQARNDNRSWRSIHLECGRSIRTVRDAWGRINQRIRGGDQPTKPASTREIPTHGNEALLRGIPLFVPGVRLGGAINGTRPGDPAWRAEADAALPAKRRIAS